uniref:Uncharacterized protein n=1 Tax=Parascaris equorum TaxID=6256 RepID=A0A914RE07_PAREQ
MVLQAFVKQYRILLPNGRDSTVENVKFFFAHHPLIGKDKVQFGVTKMTLLSRGMACSGRSKIS